MLCETCEFFRVQAEIRDNERRPQDWRRLLLRIARSQARDVATRKVISSKKFFFFFELTIFCIQATKSLETDFFDKLFATTSDSDRNGCRVLKRF